MMRGSYVSVTELAQRMKWIWLKMERRGKHSKKKNIKIRASLELGSRCTERDHLASPEKTVRRPQGSTSVGAVLCIG